MASYRQRRNRLDGVKQLVTFVLIALVIGAMVYLMYTEQIKKHQLKVVTDPIVLTNPGGVIEYQIDDETMEEIDDNTGLKSIFQKLTGKITDGEK